MFKIPSVFWVTAYDFFKDQGSVIGGICALLAALIAVAITWIIGQRQILAVSDQSALLQKQSKEIVLWNQILWADQERQRDQECLQGIYICQAALNRMAWQLNRVRDRLSVCATPLDAIAAREIEGLIKEWIDPPPGEEITAKLTRMAASLIGNYDLLVVAMNDFRVMSTSFSVEKNLEKIANLHTTIEAMRSALTVTASITQKNIERYNHVRPEIPLPIAEATRK